jgi:hypothetical protein
MATLQQIADGARQLPQGAQIAVGGTALLGADAMDPRIDRLVASLVDGLGIPREDAAPFRSRARRRRLPSGSRHTPTPARHGSCWARSATTGTPSGS